MGGSDQNGGWLSPLRGTQGGRLKTRKHRQKRGGPSLLPARAGIPIPFVRWHTLPGGTQKSGDC